MTAPLPEIERVAVRTPTLPPATHTNTWILGRGSMTVVDPASPWEDEQQRLFEHLWERTRWGEVVERLFLTHHHHDHVAGAVDLQQRLAAHGVEVPILAHPVTRDLLSKTCPVDHVIEDRETLACGSRTFVAHHTPGHAPGHLVLHDVHSGAVVAGDMVAGVGTIAIDPREGDLQDYLDSLEHLRTLEATALLPAHGPVLEHPETVLSFYIAHRHSRTDQIRDALGTLGTATPLELAPIVYPELDTAHHVLAAAQILTHLQWLDRHGLAVPIDAQRWKKV